MLESLGVDPVADWVLHHHERWDGDGYPEGLSGEQIPLGARIIFVADAYDAMTSDRVYRGQRGRLVSSRTRASREIALAEELGSRVRGHAPDLDPEVDRGARSPPSSQADLRSTAAVEPARSRLRRRARTRWRRPAT